MAITLTERAAAEVKRIIEEQKLEQATFLRVGVTGGGCSGFMYRLAFDQEHDDTKDARYEQHGVCHRDRQEECTLPGRHHGRFL